MLTIEDLQDQIAKGEAFLSSNAIDRDARVLLEICKLAKRVLTLQSQGAKMMMLEATTVQVNAGVNADDLRTGFETVKHIYKAMHTAAPDLLAEGVGK